MGPGWITEAVLGLHRGDHWWIAEGGSWVIHRGGPGWITEEVLGVPERMSWVDHRGSSG